MSDTSFKHKIVLITGGGSGIGQTTALAFARKSATVIVVGRRLGACDETVKMIADEDLPTAKALSVDVSDEQQVKELFEYIEEKYKKLDIAFFNAGLSVGGFIVDQAFTDFEQVMNVNCSGLWLCLRYAMRLMMARGTGSIINTLSVHSMRTVFTGTSAYTASKHAALALTKSAAFEGSAHGVRVNGVAPGPIMTDMLAESVKAIGGLEGWVSKIPQERAGTPEEVAEAVMWLASDKASFVNGTIINVDGAFLAC